MTFLLAYLNVHYLILLSVVHEYAYFSWIHLENCILTHYFSVTSSRWRFSSSRLVRSSEVRQLQTRRPAAPKALSLTMVRIRLTEGRLHERHLNLSDISRNTLRHLESHFAYKMRLKRQHHPVRKTHAKWRSRWRKMPQQSSTRCLPTLACAIQ